MAGIVSGVWPLALMPSVLVAPHFVQVKVFTPASVQVGSFVTVPAFQLCSPAARVAVQPARVQWASAAQLSVSQRCPKASVAVCAVNTVPQVLHLLPSVRPVSVQVAALAGIVSGVWPLALIVSVLVFLHTVQV